MSSDILIRRMTLADLDPVMAIEEATFSIPWTRRDYTEELTRNRVARYLVAVEKEENAEQGEIVGFAGAWVILDESHITNIAVREDRRRRGIGRRMTEALLQYLSNLGAAYATLEVRESNLPAQSLYRALGFLAVGRRKRYYEDNGEDALIMVCDRMPPADPDFEEPETVYEE